MDQRSLSTLLFFIACPVAIRRLVLLPGSQCPKFEGDITSPEGKALVDEWHEKYIAALLALWDKHKDTYAKDRKGEMRVVE